MLCSDIMKTSIECVSAQTTVRDAARAMRDRNIGFLPICDDSMRVLGTVTDRDIVVRAVAGDLALSSSIERLMTREIVACKPEDDVRKAQQLMAGHRKSRIMCLGTSGRLEGIISLSDIAQIDDAAGTLREVSAREAR